MPYMRNHDLNELLWEATELRKTATRYPKGVTYPEKWLILPLSRMIAILEDYTKKGVDNIG